MIKVNFLYSWRKLLTGSFILGILSCSSPGKDFDASGSFEAEEVMVSALQSGQLLWFSPREGDQLEEGERVGQIDVSLVKLQKEQVEASIKTLQDKTSSAGEQTRLIKQQLEVQQAQLDELLHEKLRIENLLKRDAATRKQLDDINAKITRSQKQMEVTRQQIRVSSSDIATRNRGILSEKEPLEKAAEQFNELIERGEVVNPVAGTVLAQYAHKGELAVPGKPLYKVAGLDTLWLRAYVTGDQLPGIRLGQDVQVRTDDGKDGYRFYPGTITWISARSEFTPKAVQTKRERSGRVYAIKVRVINDGYLKIGMYGELLFTQPAKSQIK